MENAQSKAEPWEQQELRCVQGRGTGQKNSEAAAREMEKQKERACILEAREGFQERGRNSNCGNGQQSKMA